MYEYVLMCYTFIQIKMDGNNWEDNPDREILDMAGVKTRHDERGLVYDDDKWPVVMIKTVYDHLCSLMRHFCLAKHWPCSFQLPNI